MSETSPLLSSFPPPRYSERADVEEPGDHQNYEATKSGLAHHFSKWRVNYIVAVFTFVIILPEFTTMLPMAALMELGVCKEYYERYEIGVVAPGTNFFTPGTSFLAPNGSIALADEYCKTRPVQLRLAELRGLSAMLESLPSTLHP